jgi:hypothetical protein
MVTVQSMAMERLLPPYNHDIPRTGESCPV